MNAISGFMPVAAPESSTAQTTQAPDDASFESFAGILAGALQTQPPVVKAAAKQNDGTSELDDSTDSDSTESTTSAEGTDGADSASAAATSAVSTPPAPVDMSGANDIVRSLAALDPALQAKLARVMSRVKDETGLDVQVAETYRSQSRQDALFAQGRETAGPVVTWTQNSKHTQGRAVDLVMSGGSSADVAAGYKTLQRIANEEGLRTLGAKDPGHLELPSSATTSATPLSPAALADASGPGGVSVARVAQLARVADLSVAQPAQVARVASVARPDTGSVNTKANPAATSVSGVAVSGVSDDASGSAGSGTFSSSQDGSGSGSGGGARYSALSAAVAMRGQSTDAFSLPSVAGMTGSTTIDRTSQILDAMDTAPARPLSQITMNVDAASGGTDRVQLSLRGATLNATIDTADPRAAQAMTARGDELSRALTRDGIDLQSLHVRTGASVAGAGLTATPSSQSSSDTSTGSRWERNQAWQQQDKQRSQQDRRNQQRQQRGDTK